MPGLEIESRHRKKRPQEEPLPRSSAASSCLGLLISTDRTSFKTAADPNDPSPSISTRMDDENGRREVSVKRGKKRKRKDHDFPDPMENCVISCGAELSGGATLLSNRLRVAETVFEKQDSAVMDFGAVNGFVSELHPEKKKEKKKKKKNKNRQAKITSQRSGEAVHVEAGTRHYEKMKGSTSVILTDGDSSIEKEKESLLKWVERNLNLDLTCTGAGRTQQGRAGVDEKLANGLLLLNGGDVHAGKSFRGHEAEAAERMLGNVVDIQGEKTQRKKRKLEDDRVLQYVLKRSVVVEHSPISKSPTSRALTTRTEVFAWGKRIAVTITSEASSIQEWIEGQCGALFGMDVEWRPNRVKGVKNKVSLLQLCGENECLIIQMLFLDRKPNALAELLFDPMKCLAGVGVQSDSKKLQQDHGLPCQGGVELTTLAVERLKREELKHVGLKVLVREVLGLNMKKPKNVTLSNWAKQKLDRAQVEYACIDAWASFALSRKLMAGS